ncbi:hypothetical protein GQ55_6G241900 [Panicum hallii var. hallii]|uniref:Uncharacterized protein n=1 Tax=Panicum hallii var. hallii TaxID=1504633 RepID=A0A2T7D912_9POAL|nr:hypothetical protein GQ55_6G241900 [Panicum hallii var. hallii]
MPHARPPRWPSQTAARRRAELGRSAAGAAGRAPEPDRGGGAIGREEGARRESCGRARGRADRGGARVRRARLERGVRRAGREDGGRWTCRAGVGGRAADMAVVM